MTDRGVEYKAHLRASIARVELSGDLRKHSLDLVKELLHSLGPKHAKRARTAERTIEAFLGRMNPPLITPTSVEACYELAREMVTLDALSRVSDEPEDGEACSVLMVYLMRKQGWTMKLSSAPIAEWLNECAPAELEEWASPYRIRVGQLRGEHTEQATLN